MDREKTKEKISFYNMLITLFWTGVFVMGSGIAWIFMNLKGILLISLLSTGFVTEVTFVIIWLVLIKRVRKLIKEM
jgi:hypothetical protein